MIDLNMSFFRIFFISRIFFLFLIIFFLLQCPSLVTSSIESENPKSDHVVSSDDRKSDYLDGSNDRKSDHEDGSNDRKSDHEDGSNDRKFDHVDVSDDRNSDHVLSSDDGKSDHVDVSYDHKSDHVLSSADRKSEGSNDRNFTSICDGTIVHDGEAPFMAFMHEQHGNVVRKCGAAVWNDHIIITAAHCLNNIDIDDVRIYVGTARPDLAPLSNMYRISRILIHHRYHPATNQYDIAALILERRIRFNTPELPVKCIPRPLSNSEVDNDNCWLHGWARNPEEMKRDKKHNEEYHIHNIKETDGKPEVEGEEEAIAKKKALMKLPMQVQTDEQCQKSLTFYHSHYNLCAHSTVGSVYQGDSGGPLVCRRKDQQGLVYVGIVSQKETHSSDKMKKPIIFTKVAYLKKWLAAVEDYFRL